MKRSTKGALAASAAGILLLGGAGSLAFWTADGDANGGSITAGTLTLTDGTCDAAWTYAAGSAGAGNTVALFVPGDVVTKQCTFTVGATGDNLTAEVDAPASVEYTSAPTGTSLSLTAASTFAITGDPAGRALLDGDTITSADGGETITATFQVTIPFGTDETGAPIINGNDTQGITATLDALTVTLTQVQS
ncbi:alternate-type signal peptide domain-containing protein [Aeromicrobium sp.]|uniref:alternate-type signal peptide domain-containing protein n=1 Tax=Aeromicrobium sp. TaxID=1871063 RepID=UPI002FC837FA